MAWSAKFLSKLSARNAQPMYILEGYRWGVSDLMPQWKIGSHGLGAGVVERTFLKSAVIVLEGSSVTGAELSPRDATCQLGAFTVAFRGTPAELFNARARRGQLVALRMGFAGDPISAFEIVEVGTLWNIVGNGGLFAIECRDFAQYLANRKTSSATNLKLFDSLGTTTTLGSSYNVGNTTVTVASTTGFDKQNDGSGTLKGVIRIEDSTPFYLTYTGKTGTTFTGCSTTGQFGTTASGASSGTTVTEIGYMDDHPLDAIRRILVSTGTAGANGSYDTLPATWGLGVPNGLVDHNDVAYFRGKTQPASGSDDYDILVEEEQVDGLSWANGILSPGGFFLCPHQGGISARAVVNPRVISTFYTTDWPITDDHIMGEATSWEGWSTADQIEYASFKATTATGTSTKTGTLSTWPAVAEIVRDLSTQVFANESAFREELRQRLGPWHVRVPEIVRCTLRGWHWGGLSPGDVVKFSSRLLSGRQSRTRHGFDQERGLVLGRSPQWFGAPQTDITIAFLSDPDEPTA
jgi:hypothetical protein